MCRISQAFAEAIRVSPSPGKLLEGDFRARESPRRVSCVAGAMHMQCNTMHCMEDQITIRLPRELTKALREKAASMQRKPSEVVRIAVREFLELSEEPQEHPAERVRDLIGSLESGVPDLAVRHREYLLKKLRRGRWASARYERGCGPSWPQ